MVRIGCGLGDGEILTMPLVLASGTAQNRVMTGGSPTATTVVGLDAGRPGHTGARVLDREWLRAHVSHPR